MLKKRIILLYLIIITIVIVFFPTVSFSYPTSQDTVQYIENLSNEIYSAIQKPDDYILNASKGSLKLKLFLSPWGELKDVYISESSGSKELDDLCVRSIRSQERYEPFTEAMGDKDVWFEVPIVFKTDGSRLAHGAGSEHRSNSIMSSYSSSDQHRLGSGDSSYSSSGVQSPLRVPSREDGGSLSVNDAVDMAQENHIAGKVAQEEIGLARLKILEANRALYPAASLNFLETTGKTTGTTQDFTDKEYKVKFEYPLYYGWRLKYAIDQAKSNLKASTANYDKVLQDLRMEVEVAFYSYVTSKINVKIHKELLEEINKIFDIAKKRFDMGLNTKAEFLQVESQVKQVQYQIASSENEFAIARLNLAQAMNIEESAQILDSIDKDPIKDLEPVNIDVTLEECIDTAFTYRSDIKAKEHMVTFNDYERKIQETKNQLRVDLTGTYGKSGGAYESETLRMGNDWALGFKVTKPLGGNTLSTAYTKDKTSQKHGQSTRTESESQSVELGLLDGLQHFSEQKSAEIAFQKARDELQQVKDTVIKEVKDSYLNYKKGLAQIASNLNKIKYREEELKLAKARSELNEMAISELIQAHMSLSDERSYYVEAVGSLYQALAKLNKATGYALFVDDESFQLAQVKK